MMDADLRRHAEEAGARLDTILAKGADAAHAEIQAATAALIAFRNGAIAAHRAGRAPAECRDGANALVSLAYGIEFPLSGHHEGRVKQAREALAEMLEPPSPGRDPVPDGRDG